MSSALVSGVDAGLSVKYWIGSFSSYVHRKARAFVSLHNHQVECDATSYQISHRSRAGARVEQNLHHERRYRAVRAQIVQRSSPVLQNHHEATVCTMGLSS